MIEVRMKGKHKDRRLTSPWDRRDPELSDEEEADLSVLEGAEEDRGRKGVV